MACYFESMFTGCDECTRLWRAYTEAITSHIRAENKLKSAILVHRMEDVQELSGTAEDADYSRMEAREAILDHEAIVHCHVKPYKPHITYNSARN